MATDTESNFSACRTCLKPIPKQSDVAAGASNSHTKLSACFSELNLALTSNPALCNSCTDAVDFSFKFKMLCYQTEVRILKYLQQAGPNITTANLAQIATANQNESVVVDLHVKEEIVDIKQEPGDYRMDNCIQQNINSQLASTNDNSSHKSGKKIVTTKKCYRKRRTGEIDGYRCHKCPYKSTYKLQFNVHIRTHLTKSCYLRLPFYKQRKKVSANFLQQKEKCNKTQKHTKLTLTGFNGRNNLKGHRHSTKYNLSLRKHNLLWHSVKKTHRCNECGYITEDSRDFMCHMMMHQSSKAFIGIFK